MSVYNVNDNSDKIDINQSTPKPKSVNGKISFYSIFEYVDVDKRIDSLAFCNCSSLKEITLPSNVTKIGDDAFK